MPQPNFLIIMSDEHDPRVSQPYGHPFVRTPNLQRLAERGVVFENGYCNAPLCTPSRSSFMTGKYPHRIAAWDNMSSLSSDEPTWAHHLNTLGYDTALCGKAHFVGPDQRHGFKRRLVEDIHGSLNTSLPDWERGDGAGSAERRRRLDNTGPGDTLHQQYDDEVTARSVEYLSDPARQSSRWALYVGLITPHFPLVARQSYFDAYYPGFADLPRVPAESSIERLHPQNRRLLRYFGLDGLADEPIRRARAAYYGLVSFCDERIGEILRALEQSGLAEDTVIAYVADHGEMLGEHGLWWKCTFYEGSTRIPFIISCPKRFSPGRRSSVTSLVDLTRTLLELAGADAWDVDGRSLVPLLERSEPDGEGLAIAEYEAHGTILPARMVRRGRYKLNYYYREDPELFDLERDPDELSDLAQQPESVAVREELTAIALSGWDPAEISRAVRHSQRMRRIMFDGSQHLPKEQWPPQPEPRVASMSS